jgi:hypothetical protein
MHPPSKCKRLALLNSKRKEENLKPISMSEDGEITWVNEPPVLDVQESIRNLMDRVAVLEAESKARKVAETPPPIIEEPKAPKSEQQGHATVSSVARGRGRGTRGSRGTGRGGRGRGSTTN